MIMNDILDTKTDLLKDLRQEGDAFEVLNAMAEAGSKYVKDLRINLKNTLKSEHLSEKETALVAYSVAVNERAKALINAFSEIAKEAGATEEELAETAGCASLLSVNNVFYRFRHFMEKENYTHKPAKIKMSLMIKPVLGKEFFELVSLVISAVNGCESCVKSHEASVLQLGSTEDRVFDAVRLGAVVTGLSKIIY